MKRAFLWNIGTWTPQCAFVTKECDTYYHWLYCHGSPKIHIIRTLLWHNRSSGPHCAMDRSVLRMFTKFFLSIFIHKVDNNVLQQKVHYIPSFVMGLWFAEIFFFKLDSWQEQGFLSFHAYLELIHVLFSSGARNGIVLKALRYNPAGHGFDSRWCHWNFSVTWSFLSHCGPGVDSASKRNEYQVYFLGVKAAGA